MKTFLKSLGFSLLGGGSLAVAADNPVPRFDYTGKDCGGYQVTVATSKETLTLSTNGTHVRGRASVTDRQDSSVEYFLANAEHGFRVRLFEHAHGPRFSRMSLSIDGRDDECAGLTATPTP